MTDIKITPSPYGTWEYIPAGGMALTAEQVEDVRTVAFTKSGSDTYLLAGETVDRLRALFPATEPAEEVTQAEGFCSFCGWSRDACARGEGECAPAEPAEEETKAERVPDWVRQVSEILDEHAQARCPSEIEGWGCSLTNGHDGDHTAHDQDGPAYVWPASSPVVPARTETGPWQTWQEVPEGRTVQAKNRHTYTKRDGILCIGTSTMKSCMATSTHRLAPFVAAEEG